MAITTSIWPLRRANFVMGVSALTIGAMGTPAVREKIHETLHVKPEDQVAFDVLVVAGATALGLYGIYQRGRRDAENFILSSPESGGKQWIISEGGTIKKPKYAWEITILDPKEVNKFV